MNKSKEIYRNKLGRIYYINHIFETFLIKLLSSLSVKHIKNNNLQVAVFAFDGIGTTINIKGVYEREQLDTVLGYLNLNHLVKGSAIDIGANIGNHSLYFSKFYKDVFSFESNPRTFKLLEINSKLVDNITPFNYGLSDIDGNVSMRFSEENMGGSRIVIKSEDHPNIVNIKVKTFDSIAHKINQPIGLIKLDIEGHEYAAISGAQSTIKANKPIILFEQSVADFKDGISPVIELLKSLGYSKFATVMPSPFISMRVPGVIRTTITFCIRLIFGFKYKIVINADITPGFYSFIVAIPG